MKHRVWSLIAAMAVLLFAGLVFAADGGVPQPIPPESVTDAVQKGLEAFGLAKAGQWMAFSSAALMIIMFVLRITKVLEKIGRWKYIVLPVLSIGSAMLATLATDLSIAAAFSVFTANWATGMLQQLVEHGIMGKPHDSGGTTPAE